MHLLACCFLILRHHSMGLSGLVGTDLLRASMHGFYINAQLYNKVCLMLGGQPTQIAPLIILSLFGLCTGSNAGRALCL